jgi:hypothetical protein
MLGEVSKIIGIMFFLRSNTSFGYCGLILNCVPLMRLEMLRIISRSENFIRLLDIETKNLEQKLLFFAIDEKPKADNAENGGEDGNKNRNKNGDENKVDEVVENLY